MASNEERSANLLNLLKFSSQNAATAAIVAAAGHHHQQQPLPLPQPQPHPAQMLQFLPQQQHQHPQQQQQQFGPHHGAGHHQNNQHHGGHHHLYQPSSLSHSFEPIEQQQQQQHQQHQQHQQQHHAGIGTEPDEPTLPIHQPAPTAADPTGLLAALMRGAREADEPKLKTEPDVAAMVPMSGFSSGFSASSPGPDTRTYLLNLLNRPKPGQTDHQNRPLLVESSPRSPNITPQSGHDNSADPARAHPQQQHQHRDSAPYFDYQRSLQQSAQSAYSHASGSHRSFAARPGEPSDYTSVGQAASVQHSPNESNLTFGAHKKVESTSTRPVSPVSHEQPQQPQPPQPPTKKPQGMAVPNISPVSKHSPVLGPGPDELTEPNSPVPWQSPVHFNDSEEGDAADPAPRRGVHEEEEEDHDDDGDEAATAEEVEEEIAADLQNMLDAKTDLEFDQTAHVAAQAIQRELDREENAGLLETALQPDVARQVRDIVDEAAATPADGVADSWESVDQDDAPPEEQTAGAGGGPAAVRVFNFPMRPWISISLVPDATEPRPLFSDRTVMDVAKLKKDFDQVDRNLFTATQHYMAYGMSRAGGIRVICQDDGRDAKVFTDTNDRIFNVSMPVSPVDHAGVRKEAVVGTGISGTVYWVEIRDGQKDRLEDAHLEQYGFALPPITAQDGDTPSGMLKTRARISSAHPEYFAVGRGKWIHMVWPGFILRHRLFRPGHDRVVDTDRLARRCSLRINTGKAGKDFCFSPDDTAIVSLDKSGRVKFWDVRELVAAAPGTDDPADAASRADPMPAHTVMEITSPLLTLATTPEGEKAWPTSVLLVDKTRPFQRRTALRYLIVGMKQNHSLQLWDLALGKPVQELNLPHGRESDAVCSVMYHAPTGMLVIGHPTRNSIYFAHVSAPKYTLRPLSQAEFMQRIANGDSTLPQPDSTAVISGVREYSFANRGVLRSLDILPSPAVAQDSDDEPTLFELYAMHSRGVACLLVKQSDLGWTEDNKVLAPVDALGVGAIAVSKIKVPPAEPAAAAAGGAMAGAAATEDQQPKQQQMQQQQNTPTQFRIAARPGPRDSPGNAAAVAAAPSAAPEPSTAGPIAATPAPAATPTSSFSSASTRKLVAAVEPTSTPIKSRERELDPHSQVFSPTTATAGSGSGSGPGSASTAAANRDKLDKRQQPAARKKKSGSTELGTNGVGPSPGGSTPAAASSSSPSTSSASVSSSSRQAEPGSGPGSNMAPGPRNYHNSRQAVQDVVEPLLTGLEARLSNQLIETFKASLKHLHAKIEDGVQLRDSDFDYRQRRLLDMVSEVLNDNTQKVLKSMIQDQFMRSVIPAISDVAGKAVGEQLHPRLAMVSSSIRDEIRDLLPETIHMALHRPEFSHGIAERVGAVVSAKMEHELVPQLSQMLSNVVAAACQMMLEQSQQQIREQVDHLTSARRADSAKIEQLFGAIGSLTETVTAMANSQAKFQDKFLKQQQQTQAQQQQMQQQQQQQVMQQVQQQMQQQQMQQMQMQQPQQQQPPPPQQQQQSLQPQPQMMPQSLLRERPDSNNITIRDSERFEHQSQNSQDLNHHPQQQPQQQHPLHPHHHRHIYGSPSSSSQAPSSLPHQLSPVGGQLGSGGPGSHQVNNHGHYPQQQDIATSPGQSSTQAALSRANAYIARQANSRGVVRSDKPSEQVQAYFESQQYEKALLAWIQSGTEDPMFDSLVYQYNPIFMQRFELPILVLMSIATTVSQNLTGPHVAERVAWIDTTLQCLEHALLRGSADEQVARVMPKVMGLVGTRLEILFTEVSQRSPTDPALPSLSKMVTKTGDIVKLNNQWLGNEVGVGYMG